MKSAGRADVTVGIVTYNDDLRLVNCLDSLLGQELLPQAVVVIDAAASQVTRDLVARVSKRAPFSVHYKAALANNIGANRNQCVLMCESPFLAFIDSDCVARPTWLSELTQKWRELIREIDNLAALGGQTLVPEGPHAQGYKPLVLMHSHFLGHLNSPQARPLQEAQSADHIPTNNGLFCVKALKAAGGFSRDFSFVCEDVEVGRRLRKQGLELMQAPVGPVEHHMSVDSLSWLKKMFKYGQGQFLVIEKYPEHLEFRLWLPICFFGLMAFSVGASFWSVWFLAPALAHFLILGLLSLFLCLRAGALPVTGSLLRYFLLTHYAYAVGEVFGLFGWTYRSLKKRIQSGFLRILKLS